ncbi:MAG: NAD-dependent epimerase/dehydratase family protein [Patescibacteria group bacterium]
MINQIKNKIILITGGAGFIGSHLAEKLAADNRLIIYDNFHRNVLKYTNLLDNPRVKIIKGDILDSTKLSQTIVEASIVIHMAAIAGVESVAVSPLETLEINLMGTYNLLRAINGKAKRIEKFIFYSTSEVYGPFVYQAKEDGMTTQGKVSEQRWAYSTSKIAAEHWCYAYFKRWQLPIVIIRPFNIYGERQEGESAISKFAAAAIKNKPIEIFGSGNQIRSWCHVDDMVQGTLAAATSRKAIGQVYNIGNPEETLTVLELAKKVIKIARSRSKIVFKKRNYPDVELRIPSIEKARKELAFEPRIDLDEGLKRTIKWYRGKS